jgi:general secretion pathway protein L
LNSSIRGFLKRWKCGWAELVSVLAHRRVLPSVLVRVVRDKGELLLRVPGFLPEAKATPAAAARAFVALELPEGAYLTRRLELPEATRQELQSAVRLEVEASSPFPAAETLWGWDARTTEAGGQIAQIAITARHLAQRTLDAYAGRADAGPATPELWVPVEGGYATLQGFGEAHRLAAQRRQMRGFALTLGAALVLALLLALTPLAQKRFQVLQANLYQVAVNERAAPVLRLRDELSRMTTLKDALAPRIQNRPDIMALLDRVSAILPDDAWLEHLEYTNTGVRFGGRAADASALLQMLQRQAAFTNVRSTSSIVLDPRSGKDLFVFEMEAAK